MSGDESLLPSGTVTFCFTDIEGSTRLLSALGDRYEAVLDEHRSLIRDATARHRGFELQTEGDGCFLVFAEASGAVGAARDIQRAMAETEWPGPTPVRVRIGLHSGEAQPSGDRYVALAVHQAARVADAGHGGQVVVSEATAERLAVEGAEAELQELGRYGLRSFDDPCRLLQLVAPGLESRFPPLRANTASLDRLLGRRSELVGRERERNELRSGLARAVGGNGGMWLLAGEPGVGKTRLTEDIAAEAASQGALTLRGHCYEGADDEPYTPFIELLEHASRTIDEARFREMLGTDAAQVARIFPELRRIFADIPTVSDAQPDQERRDLFNAMRDGFGRMAQARPLVLVFDDLHWADDATLALLRHLARALPELPILVLGTYRDVESDIRKGFADALEQILRRRLGERLELRRLDETHTWELVTGLVGQPVPREWVSTVHEATDGNPFFVEEIVKHLAEEGRLLDEEGRLRDGSLDAIDVPKGVRLVVGKRLERLGEASRKSLSAAAVMGRQFSFELLDGLGLGSEDDVLDGLDEAESAGLVTSLDAGYRFAHGLIRQTLLASLSPPRRQRLHLRIADAIEAVYGDRADAYATDLARHLFAAGGAAEASRTVRALSRVGYRALTGAAPSEAIGHFENALSLASQDARPDLLYGRGRCQLGLGRWDDAVRDLRESLDGYEAAGNAEFVGRASGYLSYIYTFTARNEDGIAVCRRGLAALGEDVTVVRARLQVRLGMFLFVVGERDEGAGLVAQAEAIARKLDDANLAEHIAQLKCFIHYCVGEWRETADAGKEVSDLSRQSGEEYNSSNAQSLVMSSLVVQGRLDEAAAHYAEWEPVAKRLRNHGAWLGFVASDIAATPARGADPEAFAEAAQALLEHHAKLPVESAVFAHVWLGATAHWLGRDDEAIEHWRNGDRITGADSSGIFGTVGWASLLLGLARAGRTDDASALLERSPQHVEPPGSTAALWPGAWNRVSATAECLLLLGRVEEAGRFLPVLEEGLRRGAVLRWIDGGFFQTTVARVVAAAGDAAGSDARFEAALALAERFGHRIEQAEIRRHWGQACLDRPGNAERGRELLAAAAAGYRALGMAGHAERAALSSSSAGG